METIGIEPTTPCLQNAFPRYFRPLDLVQLKPANDHDLPIITGSSYIVNPYYSKSFGVKQTWEIDLKTGETGENFGAKSSVFWICFWIYSCNYFLVDPIHWPQALTASTFSFSYNPIWFNIKLNNLSRRFVNLVPWCTRILKRLLKADDGAWVWIDWLFRFNLVTAYPHAQRWAAELWIWPFSRVCHLTLTCQNTTFDNTSLQPVGR